MLRLGLRALVIMWVLADSKCADQGLAASAESLLEGKSDFPNFWAYGVDYSDAHSLPECSSACAEFIFPILTTVLQKGSNHRRIQDACNLFDRAESCMKQLTHCPRNELYITLSSGIRYMCVEQRQAFDANAECMDKVNEKVYSECDATCSPQSLINGFALKDVFTKGFAEGLDYGIVKKFIDPHLTKIFFSESCRIGQCLLQCYRNKFNLHCDGSAGSLLAEAIVRPFDSSEVQSLPLGAVFGAFLPTQCRFIYDAKSVKKFRIDPQLDVDLRRVYGSGKRKVITTEERVVEAISQFQSVGVNPFEQAGHAFSIQAESPIDSGYQALSRARRRSHNGEYGTDDASDRTLLPSARPIFASAGNKLRAFRMLDEVDDAQGSGLESGGDRIYENNLNESPKNTRMRSESRNSALGDVFEDPLVDEAGLQEKATAESRYVHRDPTEELLDVGVNTFGREGEKIHWPRDDSMEDDTIYASGSDLSSSGWHSVEDAAHEGEAKHTIEFGAKPGADGVTVLQLERTIDNADLYLAQWVRPDRTYRVDVNVHPEDEGEFVCLLRTYKAFAVNKLTDEDIEALVEGIERSQ